VANRDQPSDTKFYSATNPATYQVSRQEQVLEILRNVTTNPPDRVKQYSFKGSGGSFAKLFDGTEQTVSWDNILWMMRTVSVPAARPGRRLEVLRGRRGRLNRPSCGTAGRRRGS
jgi:hypothetical protein